MTLAETAVAACVATVALMSLIATLSKGAEVRRSAEGSELAAQILRAELERYRSLSLNEITTTVMDGAPAGTARTVVDQPGLTGGALTVEILSEQTCATQFGLAQAPDLDGDGDPAVSNVELYGVVPARFTISWTENGEARSRQATTFFYPRSGL